MYVFSWIIIPLCYSKTYLRSTSIETFLYLCQTQRDSASVVTLKSFKSRLKLYLQGNVIHSHVSQCSTVIYGIPYNIVLTHFRALNVEYFVEYDGIAIIWKTNENWYFSRYISMKNLIHVIHDILRAKVHRIMYKIRNIFLNQNSVAISLCLIFFCCSCHAYHLRTSNSFRCSAISKSFDGNHSANIFACILSVTLTENGNNMFAQQFCLLH